MSSVPTPVKHVSYGVVAFVVIDNVVRNAVAVIDQAVSGHLLVHGALSPQANDLVYTVLLYGLLAIVAYFGIRVTGSPVDASTTPAPAAPVASAAILLPGGGYQPVTPLGPAPQGEPLFAEHPSTPAASALSVIKGDAPYRPQS
jgi:hypothetical protein